jgi:hypothetical protein
MKIYKNGCFKKTIVAIMRISLLLEKNGSIKTAFEGLRL